MTAARSAGAFVAAVMLVAACGSDNDSGAEPTAADTAPVATEPDDGTTEPQTTESPSATEAPVATEAAPATDAPNATDVPEGPPSLARLADVAGLAVVELIAPSSGGSQPMLAWSAVEGAAGYRLVVLTADGSPYWAWLGPGIEVRFGGPPEGGGQTAILFEPMTWTVIAVDEAGVPIAISERGDLTP